MNKQNKLKAVKIKAEVGKWGCSLAVRVPKLLCDELKIKEGSTLLLNNLEVVEDDE